MSIVIPEVPVPPARAYDGRSYSLQFTPVTPIFSSPGFSLRDLESMVRVDEEFETEKEALRRNAEEAAIRRERKQHHALQSVVMPTLRDQETQERSEIFPASSLFTLLRTVYPTIPANRLFSLDSLSAC